MSGWQPQPATALLILRDGTRLEGRGIGAVGQAAGEVCFNTAMTGYEEILTDPSYAGQIVTFTFPHIGNVGANDEDIETVNMAALSGVRGVVLKADVTNPSNYRAVERLDAWLRKRNIVGITGIDTRALTARIRESGMADGVVAHAPDGVFDEPTILAELKAFPGLEGLDLAKDVSTAQTYKWDQTPWRWNEGYGTLENPKFHIVAVDYGAKRNILRQLANEGARVTVVPATATAADILAHKPDGIFLSNGPGDPAATGEYAVPTIQSLMQTGKPIFGICLGHQLLGIALGGSTDQDASGPPRRQSSGQRPDHRQGRDHLDEPRLRGRERQPAEGRDADPCLAVRRLQRRPQRRRQADLFSAVSPRSVARAARQPLPLHPLPQSGAGPEGPARRARAGRAAVIENRPRRGGF